MVQIINATDEERSIIEEVLAAYGDRAQSLFWRHGLAIEVIPDTLPFTDALNDVDTQTLEAMTMPVAGFFVHHEDRILIRRPFTAYELSHEAAHGIDKYLGYPSRDPAVDQLYRTQKQLCSDRANMNPEEWVAEALAARAGFIEHETGPQVTSQILEREAALFAIISTYEREMMRSR